MRLAVSAAVKADDEKLKRERDELDKFVANSFLNIVTSNFNYQVTKLSQLPTSTSLTQKYCKLFQI